MLIYNTVKKVGLGEMVNQVKDKIVSKSEVGVGYWMIWGFGKGKCIYFQVTIKGEDGLVELLEGQDRKALVKMVRKVKMVMEGEAGQVDGRSG